MSRLAIDIMTPQHGAINRGADVERFINWFAEIEIGVLNSKSVARPLPEAA